MRVKEAYFVRIISNGDSEYLLLNANRNANGKGWYDYLPVVDIGDGALISIFDHGEFATLRDVPREYKRTAFEALPAHIQHIAERERAN